jgi:hypothetical protein
MRQALMEKWKLNKVAWEIGKTESIIMVAKHNGVEGEILQFDSSLRDEIGQEVQWLKVRLRRPDYKDPCGPGQGVIHLCSPMNNGVLLEIWKCRVTSKYMLLETSRYWQFEK